MKGNRNLIIQYTYRQRLELSRSPSPKTLYNYMLQDESGNPGDIIEGLQKGTSAHILGEGEFGFSFLRNFGSNNLEDYPQFSCAKYYFMSLSTLMS
jgi:hypothetical protein